jgi:hypothetical protein
VFDTQTPANCTPVPVTVKASMWISRPFAFFTRPSSVAAFVPGLQFQPVLSAPLLAIHTALNGTAAAPSGRCTEISRLSLSASAPFRSTSSIESDQSHLDGTPS